MQAVGRTFEVYLVCFPRIQQLCQLAPTQLLHPHSIGTAPQNPAVVPARPHSIGTLSCGRHWALHQQACTILPSAERRPPGPDTPSSTRGPRGTAAGVRLPWAGAHPPTLRHRPWVRLPTYVYTYTRIVVLMLASSVPSTSLYWKYSGVHAQASASLQCKDPGAVHSLHWRGAARTLG